MTRPTRALALVVVVTAAACAPARADVDPARSRGGEEAPRTLVGVCEASALVAREQGASRIELVVADDEESERLFRFTHDGDALHAETPLSLPSRARVDDIEALAARGDALVVVGSHGRSRKGKLKRRARVVDVERVGADQLRLVRERDHADWLALAQGDLQRCGALFVEGARAAFPALCPALAIDVEGAFLDDDGRLFVGLRAPVVEGKAVVLRVREDGPGFDRVAFVDLGGHGIRDLSVDGGALFLLSGPSLDRAEPARLYVIERARVTAGGRVAAGELSLPLPVRAEGLALTAHHVFVVTDGERASGESCARPSELFVFPRPRAR